MNKLLTTFLSLKCFLVIAAFSMSINVHSQCTTPVPLGNTEQGFCSLTSWNNGGFSFSQGDVLTDLQVYGTNLTWYTDVALTNPIADPANEEMTDGTVYYVTQTPDGGCESNALAVDVTDKGCGCLKNPTFETQEGDPTYEDYNFYTGEYSETHKTCGLSLLGASPVTPNTNTPPTVVATANGFDPEITAENLPMANPSNPLSKYGVRVNNSNTGGDDDVTHLEKEFIAGEVFSLSYAMVLENPTSHTYEEQPFVQVKLFDKNDNLISSRCIVSQPVDCIFQSESSTLLYTNWSCIKFNTLGIIGEKARIEFSVADCTRGGHYGYAYVDDLYAGDEEGASCEDPSFGYVAVESIEQTNGNTESCVITEDTQVQGSCSSAVLSSASLPVEICGSYVEPYSSGSPAVIDDFELNIIQNNTVVGTLSDPVLNSSQGTFCFSVDAADLNVSPFGNFDFEVDIQFGLNCGAPQTVPIDDRASIDICPEAGCAETITVCDDSGNGEGIGTFDLTGADADIMGNWTDNDLDITYFEDQDDAFAGNNKITDPANFDNTDAFEQTIYAKVEWNPAGATGSDCSYLIEVPLLVYESPVLDIEDEMVICSPDEQVAIIATPQNLNSLTNVTYKWFKDGSQLPTVASYLQIDDAGQYEVVVSEENCETRKTIEVIGVDFDANLDDEIAICAAPSGEGSVVLSPEIEDRSTPALDRSLLEYEWSNGETTKEITVTESGNYFVDIMYKGCVRTAATTVFIDIEPDPTVGEDIVTCKSETDVTEVMANVPNYDDTSGLVYEWYRSDVEPDLSVENPNLGNLLSESSATLSVNNLEDQEGWFSVKVYQAGSPTCFGVDKMSFSLYENKDCVITQGLSPDSTPGQNDNLDLTFLADRAGVKMLTVYNRYGREVFKKKNYVNSFAGQDKNGDLLPTGTYYYVIELAKEDPVFGTSKKGWIYINRDAN